MIIAFCLFVKYNRAFAVINNITLHCLSDTKILAEFFNELLFYKYSIFYDIRKNLTAISHEFLAIKSGRIVDLLKNNHGKSARKKSGQAFYRYF